MLAAMRNYAQALANGLMETPVVIRHKSAPAKDPSNPYGDDTLTFDPTTTSVNGWFIDPSTAVFTSSGGRSVSVDKPTLRLPVGTPVAARDEITINGNVWTVLDASDDETWPAMLKVGLTRAQ